MEIKRLRKTSPPRLLVTRTSRFINFFLLPTINTCVFVFIELSFHFHFDGYFSPCFPTPLAEISLSSQSIETCDVSFPIFKNFISFNVIQIAGFQRFVFTINNVFPHLDSISPEIFNKKKSHSPWISNHRRAHKQIKLFSTRKRRARESQRNLHSVGKIYPMLRIDIQRACSVRIRPGVEREAGCRLCPPFRLQSETNLHGHRRG